MALRPRVALYTVIACLTSSLQFGFYDCNGERALSFVAGVLTILAVLIAIDGVYVVMVSGRSARARLALSSGIALVGVATVWSLASLTRITHLCG